MGIIRDIRLLIAQSIDYASTKFEITKLKAGLFFKKLILSVVFLGLAAVLALYALAYLFDGIQGYFAMILGADFYGSFVTFIIIALMILVLVLLRKKFIKTL